MKVVTKRIRDQPPTLRIVRQPVLALLCPIEPGALINKHNLLHCCAWSVRTPTTVRQTPIQVLYVHGGGMVSGDWAGFRGICSKLSRELGGAAVWCVNYRLLPEWTVRDAVDDVLDCLQHMNIRDPTPIACVADSGGAIALVLALLRVSSNILIACCALMSPMIDLSCSIPEDRSEDAYTNRVMLEFCFRHCRERLGAEVSNPILQDLGCLPRMLVLAAATELLLSDAVKLANKAQHDGVQVELVVHAHAFHAWPTLAGFGIHECDEGLIQIVHFIKSNS